MTAVLSDEHYAHIEAGLTATAMGRAFLARHEELCRVVAAETVLARLDQLRATIDALGHVEADDLTDLVDMMRDLRYTEARRHVREEVPFFTGRRILPAEIVEVLQ